MSTNKERESLSYRLAKEVLRVQDMHEDSWSSSQNRYKIPLHTAAQTCEDKALGEVIYLLCFEVWDDVRRWAQSVVEQSTGKES